MGKTLSVSGLVLPNCPPAILVQPVRGVGVGRQQSFVV